MKALGVTTVLTAVLMSASMASASLNGGAARVRIYAPEATCAQVQNSIAQNGAVVVYESPYIYDRYVRHAGYCATGEIAVSAWVATSNSARCYIGYACEQDTRGH